VKRADDDVKDDPGNEQPTRPVMTPQHEETTHDCRKVRRWTIQ
jgi:hypothetical protein